MRKDRLAEEVQLQLAQLGQMAAVASQLAKVSAEERRPWDAAAAAKYIADLTLGLENLCRRRCIHLGIPLPEGEDSHSRLLEGFLSDPQLGGRLPAEIQQRLKKYLRFRHRFLHGYGHEVRWEIIEEPLSLLPQTVSALQTVWNGWLEDLP
jgi:hypothetical protein